MATAGIDASTAALIVAASTGGTAVTFTAQKVLFNSVQRTADNGTDTEWATAAGYVNGTGGTFPTWAAATSDATGGHQASSAAVTITNAPAGTWQGCTTKDTTKFIWWAALASSKTINLGDTVTIPSGSFTINLG